MLSLKLAEMTDLPDVIRMVKKHAGHSSYSTATLSEDKIANILQGMIQGGLENALALLGMDGDKPVACIGGIKTELPFSYETLTQELVLWVDEPYRRTGIAQELMRQYERWSKEFAKAEYTMLSAFHTEQYPAIAKMYSRKKYTPAETHFIRKV